jgi:hypothetical protein
LLLDTFVEDPLHEVEILAHVAVETSRLARWHKPPESLRRG